MRAALPRLKWGRKNWWIVFILLKYIHREKFERAFIPPHPYGTKEKLHRKALLELQTRLKVGILASKHSFRARIQVCGERWKIWRRMLQPKSIFICSQQQVRSFRAEKSTENWKRRWKTQLNVIRMEIQLPSSERWLPCQCQIEHYE